MVGAKVARTQKPAAIFKDLDLGQNFSHQAPTRLADEVVRTKARRAGQHGVAGDDSIIAVGHAKTAIDAFNRILIGL
jgi:hypothetical protein